MKTRWYEKSRGLRIFIAFQVANFFALWLSGVLHFPVSHPHVISVGIGHVILIFWTTLEAHLPEPTVPEAQTVPLLPQHSEGPYR